VTYPGQRPTPYVAPRHRRRRVPWLAIIWLSALVAWPVVEIAVDWFSRGGAL
jgi:hypothetical protein